MDDLYFDMEVKKKKILFKELFPSYFEKMILLKYLNLDMYVKIILLDSK